MWLRPARVAGRSASSLPVARDVPRVASHRPDLTRQAVASRRRAHDASHGPDVMTFPVAATAVVPGADATRRYASFRTDRRDHRRYAFSVVDDGTPAVVPRAPRSRRHLPSALDGAEPPRCLWSPHPSRSFSPLATARRARSVPLALVFCHEFSTPRPADRRRAACRRRSSAHRPDHHRAGAAGYRQYLASQDSGQLTGEGGGPPGNRTVSRSRRTIPTPLSYGRTAFAMSGGASRKTRRNTTRRNHTASSSRAVWWSSRCCRTTPRSS